MKARYDVVVIGSGFGGAILACRLTQAGRSVCLLERGRRWAKDEFPRTTGQVARSFWNERDLGLLDYRTFRRIDVLQASGVGGGSLVYFNAHVRAPARVFRHPEWPAEIDRDRLDPYYDQAKEILQARPIPSGAGDRVPGRTRAFLAASAGRSQPPELIDICVHFGPDQANPHSGVVQSACVNCGNCLLGCHVHAKNTLDLNYIALAEAGGAEVYPLHLVESMEPTGPTSPLGGGSSHAAGRSSGEAGEPSGPSYRVRFRRLEADGNSAGEPGTVVAKTVVVAAGTLGTTELLLRCRDLHRTLPNLGPMLGQRFSGNGDLILAGTFEADREVDPGWGPPITVGIDCSTSDDFIYIEDLGFPDPFLWFLEGNLPLPGRLQNLKAFLRIYLLRTLGLSRASRFSTELDKLFRGGVTTRFLPYLGMGTDAADGRMELKDGRMEIQWDPRRSQRMFDRMETAMGELSGRIGGRFRTSPLWQWPARKLMTAHPLGGCVMSDDPRNGVVRPSGETWSYPGLFVADASIIPTALGVNPSATISALAERIAASMVGRAIA